MLTCRTDEWRATITKLEFRFMNETHQLESARREFFPYGDASGLLRDPRANYLSELNSGAAIYICDVESSRTLILETRAGALSTLSEQAAISETAYDRIRAATAMLIGDLLNSRAGVHPQTRCGVILGAFFCITETRGFHITKHHGADVQYLLVRYPDASADTQVLTPMPVFKAHPIEAGELAATVTHILGTEQLNFPNRFTRAGVMFKEARRDILAGK